MISRPIAGCTSAVLLAVASVIELRRGIGENETATTSLNTTRGDVPSTALNTHGRRDPARSAVSPSADGLTPWFAVSVAAGSASSSSAEL
jgi:hypothetical protein